VEAFSAATPDCAWISDWVSWVLTCGILASCTTPRAVVAFWLVVFMFLIYIPFVLVDLAVASILMSLGMIMVSPTLISLPLKLLMFVSIHGWVLVLGTLANSFK